MLTESTKSDCDPVVYNSDLFVKTSITGEALDPKGIAHPCGSMARSMFNGELV